QTPVLSVQRRLSSASNAGAAFNMIPGFAQRNTFANFGNRGSGFTATSSMSLNTANLESAMNSVQLGVDSPFFSRKNSMQSNVGTNSTPFASQPLGAARRSRELMRRISTGQDLQTAMGGGGVGAASSLPMSNYANLPPSSSLDRQGSLQELVAQRNSFSKFGGGGNAGGGGGRGGGPPPLPYDDGGSDSLNVSQRSSFNSVVSRQTFQRGELHRGGGNESFHSVGSAADLDNQAGVPVTVPRPERISQLMQNFYPHLAGAQHHGSHQITGGGAGGQRSAGISPRNSFSNPPGGGAGARGASFGAASSFLRRASAPNA
ncbi:unnamed protein product, partial [Amoebophrya sp. A120]